MKLARTMLVLSFVSMAATLTMNPLYAGVNNDCTTVVLHARPGLLLSCQTSLDCTIVPPTTRLDNPTGSYTVYMYLKNYEAVEQVQVAFDWPPQTWDFWFSLWQCQPGQWFAVAPNAPGPVSGTITTVFNGITGGSLAPIGLMIFRSLGGGCLSIVESSYPNGNYVIYATEITHLLDANEGRVCVNANGWNTCECQEATPVEAVSWGRIKDTYGR